MRSIIKPLHNNKKIHSNSVFLLALGICSGNKSKITGLRYDRTSLEQRVFFLYRAVVTIPTAR
jgi:hypothetical protein